MNFSFHPEAELEFTKAIDYYEDKEIGLGFDFAVEVLSYTTLLAHDTICSAVLRASSTSA